MGDAVFEQCKNLIEVVLPKTLTSTNTFMCNGCSNLEKVTIQGNTATIGMKCFYDCKKLETVICDVSTPPSLHSDAFQASNSTFKIYVPDESVDLYKTATNWVNYASRIYPISELPVE